VSVSVDNNIKIFFNYELEYEFEEMGEKIVKIKIDNSNGLMVGYESGLVRRIDLDTYEIIYENTLKG
jgi:hypothetical protein